MSNTLIKHVIFIVGPTAVGKTGIGVQLAKEFDCDVISCDSRQIYKEMAIGTAKPTLKEMDGVQHHFVDSHSIFNRYTAGMFEKDALRVISEAHKQSNIVLVVGGSGLYANALASGIEDIPFDQRIRDEIDTKWNLKGLDELVKELEKIDPEYASIADLKNPRRVKRGLEVFHTTGKKYSTWRNTKKERPFNIHWVGLNTDRLVLFDLIHKRIDVMLENGLLAENEELLQHKGEKALQTVGYQEIFKYLEGELLLEEAIELLKRNTRVFAKRQLTWFKKKNNIKWYKSSDLELIKNDIKHKIHE